MHILKIRDGGGGGVRNWKREWLNSWVGRYAIFGIMWLGKKHDVAQSNIVYAIWNKKKDVGGGGGIMLKKLNRGLRVCRLKIRGGGGWQAAISNKAKMYLSQNHKKKAISSFVFRQLRLLMTSQNSIHHITDITYTSGIFPIYI